MAWIKRNLFFLIGSVIAFGLMIFGVIVLLSQMSAEQQAAQDIDKVFADLNTLNGGPASPENIEAAREQEKQLRAYVVKARSFYQRIQPIPNFTTNRVSNAEFAADLRNTVSQLQRSARQQSVELPPEYYFSFEAQKKLMIFDPTSLDSMAVHLGEVKTICSIMFNAKVNALLGIQREIISEINDINPSDYLPLGDKTVSTPLAELTPYEVTFKCFSTELANVLAAFAGSSNGIIVKSINVEPASAIEEVAGAYNPAGGPPTVMPASPPFGFGPPGAAPPEGGGRRFFAPPTAAPVASPSRGSQVFLNEKPFRVTLYIEVVKIKSAK